MTAVKAYYNGTSFIPLEKRAFRKNQQAMIVIDDFDQISASKKSCRGIAAKYANASLINREQDFAGAAFTASEK